MKRLDPQETRRYWKRFGIPLVLGIAALIVSYVLLTWYDIQYASKATQETMALLNRRVVRFEGYESNDENKNLIRLLDKTSELSRQLANADNLNEDFLDKYTYGQRLSGILILDEDRNIVLQSESTPDSEWVQNEIQNGPNIIDIIQYPKKVYMTRTERGGVEVDMAAVARQGEEAGVVICYFTKNDIKNNANDITFETLLDGYNFELDGVGGITDGETFVSTDDSTAEQIEALSAKIDTAQVEDPYCTMLHFWVQGRRWYGAKATVGDQYALYVAFPASSVFATRNAVLLSGTLLFILFWLIYLLMQGKSERESMAQLRKQYRIINAINRAYSTNFLIQLQDDQLEPIKLPGRLESKLLSYPTASEKLKAIARMCLEPAEQARFTAFTEPSTIAQRMGKSDYLVMDYEDKWHRWYQSLLIPQRYDADGQLMAVLFATRDISDEKAREHAYQEQLRRSVEEAERASRAKTDFLRQMSHDVRTPINGIRGMIEIGNHYPNDLEKQADCRKKVWEASGFLLDLVNSVLDMNKLESGEIQLDEKPFDLRDVLSSTRGILYGQAESSHIRVQQNELDIKHPYLLGSPLHLQQILQNIGGNAIKYNKEGGTATFTTREIASDGETATFEFISSDTGIGMSKEFQKRAFEPFTQERASARTKYQGSGLGLSICRQLVEQMGGSIQLESEQGVGTTFTITLQFRLDAQRIEQERQAAEAESIAGMKALLVEDNELNMEIAEFLLEREGVQVTKAWNGQEAVQQFAASQPGEFDVILMDVMMPVMGGIEATQAIRALDRPDAATVPIFAMTANAFADDIARGRAAGMNEYIAKPLDGKKLAKTLLKYKKQGKTDLQAEK